MFRTVAMRDTPQIAAIYNHYVLSSVANFEVDTLSNEEMAQRIRDILREGPYFVYTDNEDNVLGYCYAHLWKRRQAYFKTYETTIYLHPEHIHKGIGTMLLRNLIEACRQLDIHVLIACITAENFESIHLHEKFGFEKVSFFTEVGYKFGRFLNVVDYELIINKD